jgi:transcriptional regulator with XRE-family HTH domain
MPRPKNAIPNQHIRFSREGSELVITFGDLGRLLKAARTAKRHSLEVAAQHVTKGKHKVGASTLSRIETHKHMPSKDMVERLLFYIYGQTAKVNTEVEGLSYRPSSDLMLLRNFLNHVQALDDEDRHVLAMMFSALTTARATLREAKALK